MRTDDPRGGRMEKQGVAALLVTLVLAGCASSTQPSVMVYPAKGQSAEQQTRDSGECQTWAKQQTGFDPATEAGKGAAVGARSEEGRVGKECRSRWSPDH